MGLVLVTGFEPFDGYTINPSAEIAKNLNGRTVDGFKVIGEVLPLDYTRALGELDTILAKHRPTFILLCGQATRASITIERIAVNAISIKRADNYENLPETDIIDDEAPPAYFTNIDPHPLVEAIVEQGIPAHVSYHAGIYGCNWILYNVLKQIDDGCVVAKATFIHLPPLPAQAIEKEEYSMPTMELKTMVKALEIIIGQLR